MSQILKPKKGYKKVNLGGQINIQIPELWAVTTLEDISDNGTQNGLAISTSDYGKGIPIVGMTKFYASEILTNDNMKEVVISKKIKELFSLKSFDLLFGRRSMDGSATGEAGKCIIVSEIKTPIIFESSVIRMSIKKEYNPFFIYQLFKSFLGKRMKIRIIRVSAVSGISSGDLKKMKIPLPPKTEQDKIKTILSNVDSQITSQTQYKEKLELLKKSLMQKLLTGQVRVTV
ncbi:MAG: restriction endonuclease subunit S [Thaumarchaeota archaeon]|nr:restriction endonuclease subunit S [Nitrososphaerota archaeon]